MSLKDKDADYSCDPRARGFAAQKDTALSKVADLPNIIPLFPLPNLVLFPGVSVPLRIFEPRYREMVAEVSAAHGIIGMMLLKGNWEPEYYSNPDVYPVGCAGRISRMVKQPDGEYYLILDGVSEFRLAREIRDKSYRQGEVQWCPTNPESLNLDAESMEGLRVLLFEYLGDTAAQVWSALIEQRKMRGPDLINFLCFHLDVAAIEKQTLLEAGNDRVDCLFDVLTFKVEERKLGSGAGGGSGNVQ